MQTLSIGPLATVYEFDGQVTNEVKKEKAKEKEIITYSKGVQASIDWSPSKDRGRGLGGSDTERDESPTRSPKSKRLSRRQKEKDEEIRLQLRKEIEEEIKAAQQAPQDGALQTGSEENFPFKTLTNEELTAVENSDDFIGFLERSTKVLERALDQQLEYDILADYANGGVGVDDEDEGYGSSGGKKGRRIKEIAQFWDQRWSKKRMISDLGFSTKVYTVLLRVIDASLTCFIVPRTCPSILYEEPVRTARPRRSHSSLELAHARPTRVHIPCSVRYSHCKVLSISPKPHRRWRILGPSAAMGYSCKVCTSAKDTAHRLGTYPPSLLTRHCRNAKCEQHHLVFNRRCRVWLDCRYALATTRVSRTDFTAACKDG